MKKSVAERLAEKVDCSGGPDACWPWLGGVSNKYGTIYFAGKDHKTHVVALELSTGEKANGRLACHTCDNPLCCNPVHLYWGTKKSNAEDRDRRGRAARLRGEAHGCAKLTAEQVMVIRDQHKPRDLEFSASALARKFGVTTSTVHLIVHNRLWV